MTDQLSLFSGTAHRPLAEGVAAALGVSLGGSTVERFPDGEVTVHLLEPVRRRDAFIVQPTGRRRAVCTTG